MTLVVSAEEAPFIQSNMSGSDGSRKSDDCNHTNRNIRDIPEDSMTATTESTAGAVTAAPTTIAAAKATPKDFTSAKTPPRHNYANPHTPIASIKRPRSSIEKSRSKASGSRSQQRPLRRSSSSGSSSNKTRNSSASTTGHAATPKPNSDTLAGASTPHPSDRVVAMDTSPVMTTPSVEENGIAGRDLLQSPNPKMDKDSHAPVEAVVTTPCVNHLSPMHPPRRVHREGQDGTVVYSSTNDDSDEILTAASSLRQAESKESTSWVGRRVDALFSPVLQFLNHAGKDGGNQQQRVNAVVSDEDVQMNMSSKDEETSVVRQRSQHKLQLQPQDSVKGEGDNDSPTSATLSNSSSSSITGVMLGSNSGHNDAPSAFDSDDITMSCRVNGGTGSVEGNVDSRDNGERSKIEEEEDSDKEEDINLDEEDLSQCESLQAVEDCLQEDEFNPWQFIASLPEYDRVKHLCPSVALPPKDTALPDITLVLDLDETLVHCTVETVAGADLTFPVEFHGITYTVSVKLRPHLQNFLEKCSQQFEVVVFTASQKVYANELLNRIDPHGKYIHHRLFRESCLAVEGNFLKDLNVLGRDLTKTVLVDNSPHAFGYQYDNGIPIESWFEDPADKELLKLEKFLRSLHGSDDVRKVVREKFQCYKLIQQNVQEESAVVGNEQSVVSVQATTAGSSQSQPNYYV